MSDPILVYRLDGRIQFGNAAVEKEFGWSAEELAGRDLETLIPAFAVAKKLLGSTNLHLESEDSPFGDSFLREVKRSDGETVLCEFRPVLVDPDSNPPLAAATLRLIDEGKRHDRSAHYWLDFDELVGFISASFIQMPPDQIDRGILDSLADIARLSRVERAFIVLIDAEEELGGVAYRWSKEKGLEQSTDPDGIRLREFPWAWNRLQEGEEVAIASLDAMPPEAELERCYLESIGAKSNLLVPMRWKGRLIGTLGLDSTSRERHWRPEFVALLRIVSEIFVGALQRKKVEQALGKREEQFRALAENLPGVSYSFARYPDGRQELQYISPGLSDLLGPKTRKAVGLESEAFLSLVHPDDIGKFAQAFGTSDLANRPGKLEYRIWTDEGYRWVHNISKAIARPDGLVISHGIILDIHPLKDTEQKAKDYAAALEKTNASLQAAKEDAESATRAKTAFLANVSHEIRTPMTAILGFLDIMADDLEHGQHAENIEAIRGSGQHLMQILNDILDLSMIEADRVEFNLERVSPRELIEQIRDMMMSRAKLKGLSFNVEWQGPIPRTIETDSLRLRQILINLVGNAIKFTGAGSVDLSIRLLDAGGSEPQLRIDVIDSGMGIPDSQLEGIFEPFNRGTDSARWTLSGTGLGLAISRRLVELLGGRIEVESTRGVGSRFKVFVGTGPLAGVELLDSQGQDAPKTRQAGSKLFAEARAFLEGSRILLVEDNEINQKLVQRLLEKAGAEISVACNGLKGMEEALDAWRGARLYDLILMDIQMPVLDGEEATRRLRAAGYPGPIMALTAFAMSFDRERCLAAGCDDHCSKPIDPRELFERIKFLLEPVRA